MTSKKKSLSNWQFWLVYIIVGGITGFIFSSILKGELDWIFSLSWLAGGTIGFIVLSIYLRRLNRN